MKKVLIVLLIIMIFTSGCAFRNTRFRDAEMVGVYVSLDTEEVVLNLCGCGRATLARPYEVIWFDNWDNARATGTMRLDVIKDNSSEPIIVEYNFYENILTLTWLGFDENIFYMISDNVNEGDSFQFKKVGDNQHRIMKCSP